MNMNAGLEDSCNSTCLISDESPLLSHEHGNDNMPSNQNLPSNQTPPGNQNKGFTLRRCMILPLFVCYCLAGGVSMYLVPQYTQHRMMEKYKTRHHQHVNISLGYSNPGSVNQPYNENHVNMLSMVMNDDRESAHTNNCFVNKSDPSYKIFDDVQKDTAMWSMYCNIASYLPALLTNLLWSSYSDILGRRFALLICCSGFAVRLGLVAAVVYFDLSLVVMVMGAAIDGMCGSFMLLFAASFSYISDITNPGKERTVAIVAIELILGLSFTVASFSSGFILTGCGYFYPALVSFCVMVCGVIILIFLVPETKQQDCAQHRSRNVFQVLAESMKFYFYGGTQTKRLKYILLILGFLFLGIPALSRGTMETLYTLGRPFCWDPKRIGYFGAIKSMISAVIGIGGVYLFRRCLADETIATTSTVLNGVSYIVEGFATTDEVLYTVPVLALLSNLPIPMIRSLMSCLTPADKQGALFASIGCMEVLCSLIGSVSSTTVYSATLSVMNGFVFLLMALLTFIGAAFLVVFMYVNRKYKTEMDTLIVTEDIGQSESS